MTNLKPFLLAIPFLFLGVFFAPRQAHAALMPYNPNNIIRDDIFTNSGTMSAASIQSFLASQGSCLATADPADLGTTGQTAAQLIYQAATTANGGKGINPQVILTTLQKEWSLITLSCASLESLYGNASGGPKAYLKRGAGYNVPDVLGVGSCLYTFTAQMLGANCPSGNLGPGQYFGGPGSMRSAFDNNKVGPSAAYPWPASFNVQEYSDRAGTITVTPVTKATSVLYRYTPYAYYGNFNFFKIFQTFFGNPVCPTNLNVIQSSSGGESAVLFEGVKYPIASLAALKAWGLDCAPPTTVTPGDYAGYPSGQPITRLFKQAGGPPVYIAQGGVRRHIRTSLYVAQAGLSDEPYSELPEALINNFPEGNPMGFLVRGSGQNEIYIAQMNVKYYIADIPTIEAWGFPLSELIDISSSYLADLPTAGNLSRLVKGSGPDIFVASLRNFYYIPSLARVQDWNMQNMSVTQLDDPFLESLPKGGSLSRVTRGTGSDTYYIENKRRYYVSSGSTSASLQRQYGTLTPMSDSVISAIPYAGRK